MNFYQKKKEKFCNEDQPYFTPELKILDRKRKIEFKKHRHSKKYLELNKKFKKKCKHSKKYFYKPFIQDLKVSNPRQWYSKVKRITCYKIHENELPQCQEISSFDDQNQAELIADIYEKVAHSYEPLKDGDVLLPEIPEGTYPKFTVKMVFNYLPKIKSNTATVHNDIPATVKKSMLNTYVTHCALF